MLIETNKTETKSYPLVSILIVHYNRPDSLEKVLSSLKQNLVYPNLEYVLTDDCSKPEVIESIRKLAFDKFIIADKNQGLGANTNKGLKACEGEYILQLQDDHVLLPGFDDFLHRGLAVLKSNNKVGMVRFLLGKKFKVSDKKNTGSFQYCIVPKQVWKNGERGFYQYSDWPHLKPATLHEELGYYLENKPMQYTENEFNIRLIRSKGYFVSYIQDYENIFETRVTTSNRNTDITSRKQRNIKNAAKNFFKKNISFLNLLRFYYWILKYDYDKRRL